MQSTVKDLGSHCDYKKRVSHQHDMYRASINKVCTEKRGYSARSTLNKSPDDDDDDNDEFSNFRGF